MQILTFFSRSADSHMRRLPTGAASGRCRWNLRPETVLGSRREPLVSVTFGGSRSSFPSLCISSLEGQPTGKGQGRGELKVGIGCVPEGISNPLEHTGENTFQQMNTPQVLVEKKPHPSLSTFVVLNTSDQVITGFFFS